MLTARLIYSWLVLAGMWVCGPGAPGHAPAPADEAAVLIELELYESALVILDGMSDLLPNERARLWAAALLGAADDHLICKNYSTAERLIHHWLATVGSNSVDASLARDRLAWSRAGASQPAWQPPAGWLDRRTGPWAAQIGHDWRTREAGPFQVHHRNDFAARRVAAAAEYHLQGISQFLHLSDREQDWAETIHLHIYQDQAELRRSTAGAGNQWGQTVIQASSGVAESIAIHVSQDSPLLLSSVIPHEIAHLLLSRAAGYRGIPPMLDEGLAMQFEPPAVLERYDRLQRELKGPGKLQALIASDMPETEADYARARLLADFLIERIGWAGVLHVLRSEEPACAALLAESPWADAAALEADWVAYITQSRKRE